MGAARSGIASARFLAKRGAVVALNDRKPLDEWSEAALDLKTEGVGCIAGEPPSWLLDQIDLVVVSPGVPTKAIPIRYADRRGAQRNCQRAFPGATRRGCCSERSQAVARLVERSARFEN